MLDYSSGLEFVARVVRVARIQQLTLLSAGVAFYGFISLVPLVLLGLGITASIGGEELAARLTAAAGDVLTPSAQELLAETVVDQTGRRSATVVGALGLLWGASRALRGLDRAFSAIYGTVATKSLLDTVWDSTLAFVTISVGLAAVGVLEVLLRLVPFLRVAYLGHAFVILGLIAAFFPLYVLFPDANVGVREALPGTIFAALGWFVLNRTFSVYATIAGEFTVYGALGAVFLVLIWLYVGAALLIVGAICNAVLADREVDRQLQSPRARQVPLGAMTDDDTGADDGTAADAGSGANGVGNGESGPEDGPDEGATSDRGAGDETDFEPGPESGPDPVPDPDPESDSEPDSDSEPEPEPEPQSKSEPSEASDSRPGAGTARTRDRSDDPEALREEIERLRDRVESFESNVESRTVEKNSLEAELKRYVRRRMRRGHARGWGPYLVLLYGTAMSIAAFFGLDGGWAILAMFVVWTSTLGLYVLMVLFGAGLSLLGVPGRLRDRVGEWRS
ncbi:YihY/virulence factor BrkB family protein [Halobiforma nitratireducens]|uniref:Ribonuclease BN n=1 Tax=Halobiforma nitratireducens JCM 10879 TaxID=1227454 RepID=M0LVA7_9EURY|nr:YihY/virulence factor BrkB family protein [Halobiforma nitratireducens]EMA36314.1 ribonuclease BN [Halobiforma nitratireducens JCM 10879]